ncbi:hypothetical protein ACQP1W_23215 [Spirillospora sp. CA-255316]
MSEKNHGQAADDPRSRPETRRDEARRDEEGAPRRSGADLVDEFRPEPVEQRESEGQRGQAEGPQVTPEDG